MEKWDYSQTELSQTTIPVNFVERELFKIKQWQIFGNASS